MQDRSAQSKFARQLSAIVRTSGWIFTNKMLAKIAGFLALGVSLHIFFGLGILLSSAIVFTVYLFTGGWRFMYVVIKTFPRDLW